MKVKELINELKKIDESLEVCLEVQENTSTIKQIRIETKSNHGYDKSIHVLDYGNFNKCVMLVDNNVLELANDLTICDTESDEVIFKNAKKIFFATHEELQKHIEKIEKQYNYRAYILDKGYSLEIGIERKGGGVNEVKKQ